MFDELTGLGNGKYLEQEYSKYINKYKDANYIMIDFTRFKKINDTYGHDIGDKCLILFADKIRKLFNDSLLVRLHGDEFVIVTHNNEIEIRKIFEKVDEEIKLAVKEDIIPLKFGFNAGSVQTKSDLNEIQNKADYMMYYAKKSKIDYQPYKKEIYQTKLNQESFLLDFSKRLSAEDFSYYGRDLYTEDDEKTNLVQVYTKDINGNNILSGLSYSTLRNNSQISKFDMFNLQNLINKISMIDTDYNYFINIDYKSLLSIKGLIDFVQYIKENTINGINNVVLSIDLSGIETTEYLIAIEIINLLSKIGFKIRLDKVDNKIADYLIEEISPKYIKVSTNLWKSVIDNYKKSELLGFKLYAYTMMGEDTTVIFEQVETEKEKEFLHDISPSGTLYSGNYYSKEKKLSLY